MDKELKHDLQHTPKETTIMLDKERTFKLDLNAYAELDMAFNDRTYYQIERDLVSFRPYAIRAFIWAGLVHEDRELSIEDVGKYLDAENIAEEAQKVLRLIVDDKAESTDEEEKEVKKK